jgi:type VI secretion system protein ImpJ
MRQFQRVLWSKGTLLNPQHFQLQDRYLEELLDFRLHALTFCPWGFSRLSVDGEKLAAGTLVVSDAAGLMPDGLVFDMPHADAAPPPLQLTEHWRADQNELLVYLGIPEHRYGGHNVAGVSGGVDTRYVADVIMVRDENTGLAEKPIQVARRNLRLLVSGESLTGTTAMPLARVRRNANGVPELDPTFIPPVIALGASPVLLAMTRRIVELLAARSHGLSALRRERNAGVADFGVSDVTNFWLLYTVNTHLPRVRHLYETRRTHPGVLFTALLELAGTLTTFGEGQMEDLPEYAHADLTTSFGLLHDLVCRLLDTSVPQHYMSLPLRSTRPTVYEAVLNDDRFFTTSQIYIAIAASRDLAARIPQVLKVSSSDAIERLIRTAVGGVRLRHVPKPPRAVPIRLDYEYFSLEQAGDDWDSIRMSRKLAVYAPKELPDPTMEVVLLVPQS